MQLKPLAFALPILLGVGMMPPQAGAQEELTSLNVLTPVPRHTSWFPLIVGETLGYFADEGIRVELIPGGDLPATAFLDNGEADLASLDATEVLTSHVRGLDFDVVYEVMHGAIEGIFVLTGNEAEDLSDLAGTTIGIVGESDRGLLISALGRVGLSEDDVTVAVLGESAPLLANSLDSGQVSAIVGAISDLVAIRSQGVEVKNLLPEEMRNQPANSFSMRADRIPEMEELMSGFLNAWAKSAYVASIDPQIVAAMTKKAAPENWVNEELGMLFLETAIGLHTPQDEVYGDLRADVWENVLQEMVESGQIEEAFEVSEILDRRFIDPANDFDRAEVEADVKAWAQENM